MDAFGGVWHAFALNDDAKMDMAERSLATIDTVVGIAAWTLTIMGIVVALVAIVGYTQLKASAIQRAEQTAKKMVEDYLASPAFADRLERETRKRVDARMAEETVARYISSEPDGDGEDAFPSANQGGQHDSG